MKLYFNNIIERDAYNQAEAEHRGCDMVNTVYWYSSGEDEIGYYLELDIDGIDTTFEELVSKGNLKFEFNVDYTLTSEGREVIIDKLTEAAEASGLGVPFESFYYQHRKVILRWVKYGGEDLKDIFLTAKDVWLDMRENENSPSPREFALNLLG